MSRQSAEQRGRRAETLAAWYLRCKGYSILDRRVKTHRGEIDLVACRGRSLVFVEVKARERLQTGAEILTHRNLARVKAAAHALAHRYGDYESIRIDAIVVAPWAKPRHIEAIALDLTPRHWTR
jgi:putative endonuclease